MIKRSSEFWNKCREARRNAGVSLSELSYEYKVTTAALSRAERGLTPRSSMAYIYIDKWGVQDGDSQSR